MLLLPLLPLLLLPRGLGLMALAPLLLPLDEVDREICCEGVGAALPVAVAVARENDAWVGIGGLVVAPVDRRLLLLLVVVEGVEEADEDTDR